jgi:hypothetical protein
MAGLKNSTTRTGDMASEKGSTTEPTSTESSTHAAFPDGMSPADYAGYEGWSDRRWAWEYLRRNKNFRTACDKLHKFPVGSAEYKESARGVANQFHLREFIHYATPFREGKTGPSFNPARVWAKIPTESESRTVKIRIRNGQIAARFDLVPALHDERMIEAQLAYVRLALEAKLKNLRESEKMRISTRRNAKDTPEDRLAWLRTLDAMHGGVKHSKIYECVYPQRCQVDKEAGTPKREWPTRLKSLARKAHDLAEGRYLSVALPKNKVATKPG